MFPWKHRAFNQGGLIRSDLISINPFSLLGQDYNRLMFSQNIWPDHLVGQFYKDVDRFLPLTSYSRRGDNLVYDKFGKDRSLASVTFEEFLFTLHASPVGSSLLGYLYKSLALYIVVNTQTSPNYPRTVPEVEGFTTYLNEDIYDGVFSELKALEAQQGPYFAYFHLYSPHSPYRPDEKHSRLFKDDFASPSKPVHPLLKQFDNDKELLQKRRTYDQQIADVDADFGRLIDRLADEGVLENSYLIVTSDHGEMFERGFSGHGGLMMYEPVLKIPLLIHAPGQQERQDVFSTTSNVDILPTILAIAEREIPPEVDGLVLPGFGGLEDSTRLLFSMDAVENSAFLPIEKAVIGMRKGDFKLITYLGYDAHGLMDELYNIAQDPEELVNLADSSNSYSELKQELIAQLAIANRLYERNP